MRCIHHHAPEFHVQITFKQAAQIRVRPTHYARPGTSHQDAVFGIGKGNAHALLNLERRGWITQLGREARQRWGVSEPRLSNRDTLSRLRIRGSTHGCHLPAFYQWIRTRYLRSDSLLAATGTVKRAANAAVFSYLKVELSMFQSPPMGSFTNTVMG